MLATVDVINGTMSAFGTKRTLPPCQAMSPFGGKADIDRRCFSRRSDRGAAGCCGSYKDLLFVVVTKLLGSGGKYG